MTHDEKIKYLKIAASVTGYRFDERDFDMLISLYELVIEKKGETDLDSICSVEIDVNERAKIRATPE